ncbi:MAG: ABC transporter permease [Anaerolineaceae bacterium]|jgi:ABC-type polysaccharide/polyol phosphate export permease|nr:ABC transporter permease [Chloroflexota bacterium]UCC52436.1 MAG: ABC transporter permease [Anaerolineaceae bacterium]
MTAEINQTNEDTTPVYLFDAEGNQGGWIAKYKELRHYRYLLRNLISRDLKARYKNSIFGVLWSLLNPLAMMLVFTLLFSVMGNDSTRDYAIFVLVGLIPWNFFSGSMISGTSSVTGNSTLVKKVYFPRELLPFSSLLSNLVNFAIAFVVLVIFLFAFKIGLTVHALWVPAILITQIIFTLGLVLLLGGLNVFYRDVMMILEVVMLAWFFLTPVFYSLELFGETATLFGITFNPAQVMRWLNPMASIIDGYRTVLWGTYESAGPVSMNPAFLFRTFVTAVIVFVLGYFVFTRLDHKFGERL